jgi:S1-C subfamily serine protease
MRRSPIHSRSDGSDSRFAARPVQVGAAGLQASAAARAHRPAADQAGTHVNHTAHNSASQPATVRRALSAWGVGGIAPGAGQSLALRWLTLAVLLLTIAVGVLLAERLQPPPAPLTPKQVQALITQRLQHDVLPSMVTRAARQIAPSVVHVGSYGPSGRGQVPRELSEGSGVVLQSSGVVLTNWHVVQGGESIRLTFADGSESLATVRSKSPDKDLAVLQALTVPDDLIAATLGSADALALGDQVVVVGYPFGIGPSVSAGVVSGKDRSYRSKQANQQLARLIQFDAAANPGNSGGPLVNAAGEVVGIVTAILNPHSQGTFVGIGFAMPIDEAAGAMGMAPF